MQKIVAICYSLVFILVAASTAHASRIALVIGNGDYQNVPSLETPVNDAKEMAAILKELGFKVIFKSNVNHRAMIETVQQFGERLHNNGGVGLFYFSGYGLQINDRNFLVPVGANIQSSADIKFESLEVERILAQMEQADNGVNIVILDACRENPYQKNIANLPNGLAKKESPTRTMIAYACTPNTVSIKESSDGHSIYTKHLLLALRQRPHLNITEFFSQIRSKVMQDTDQKQVPWESVSLTETFNFTQYPHTSIISPPITDSPLVNHPSDNNIFQDSLADGSLGPEMIWIPAGRFQMGDIQGGGDDDEQPVHWVSLDRFAMGRYEVTFAEYDRFAKATGRETHDDEGWGRGNRPVINVSWENAMTYAGWLSEQTGQQYRLPTEAQWEYAARSGNEASRYWGNEADHACRYANVRDGTFEKELNWGNIHNCEDGYVATAPVGSFQPNAFGLFDMLGNVWEWTCSEYEEKYGGKEQRCAIGKNSTMFQVIRGGSWFNSPWSLRVTYRDWYQRDYRLNFVGFRLVRM